MEYVWSHYSKIFENIQNNILFDDVEEDIYDI